MCTRHEPHNPHCSACLASEQASTLGWRTWTGGEIPVPPGVLIDVEYRNGVGRVVRAGEYGADHWGHAGHGADIVRYRLHNPPADPFNPTPGGKIATPYEAAKENPRRLLVEIKLTTNVVLTSEMARWKAALEAKLNAEVERKLFDFLVWGTAA